MTGYQSPSADPIDQRFLIVRQRCARSRCGEGVDFSEAADVFADYAVRHPRAARNAGIHLGLDFDDPQTLAARVPLVRLRLS